MYHKKLFLGLLVVLFCIATNSVVVADIYVRSGAGGSNNGTDWANAYTSLSTAESNVTRGETIWIAEGSYGSVTYNVPGSGTTLITVKKATDDAHGAASDWSSTYGDGQVTMASPILFDSPWWVLDGVIWEGFWIDLDNGYGGSCGSECGCVHVSSSGDNVVIKGSRFDGNYNHAAEYSLSFLDPTNLTLEYCHFYKLPWQDHFSGRLSGTFTITRSVINMLDWSGSAPDVAGAHMDTMNPWIGSGGWNLVFNRNIVYELRGNMFLFQEDGQMGDVTAVYNIFADIAHPVLRLGSGNAGVSSVTYYNNVFYDTITQQMDNVTEKNNIFMNSGSYEYFGDPEVHYSADVSQYNLWETGTLDFQSGTGNVSSGDPGFINPSSPLGADGIPFTDDDGFNIEAGSDAIDMGTDLGLGTDIRGNSVSATPSVGAYEYDAGATPSIIKKIMNYFRRLRGDNGITQDNQETNPDALAQVQKHLAERP